MFVDGFAALPTTNNQRWISVVSMSNMWIFCHDFGANDLTKILMEYHRRQTILDLFIL